MEHFVWVWGEVWQAKHLRDRVNISIRIMRGDLGRSQSRRELKPIHRRTLAVEYFWSLSLGSISNHLGFVSIVHGGEHKSYP